MLIRYLVSKIRVAPLLLAGMSAPVAQGLSLPIAPASKVAAPLKELLKCPQTLSIFAINESPNLFLR
jgi:hypothetical protein